MHKTKIIFLMAFFGFLVFANVSSAQIIPANRRVTWQGNVGVPGDIPNRTVICTTIDAATYGNGITDAANAIQTALNNCPANKVVYLPPGTYMISSNINVPSNVVLRGAGMGITTIRGSASYPSVYMQGVIHFDMPVGCWGSSCPPAVNLTSGYTKGSTVITTASNHNLSVGDFILIDQIRNDTSDPPVTDNESEGAAYCGRDGTRFLGQADKVVSVDSPTQVTLETPLYWNYDASSLPQLIKLLGLTNNSGVEDLTIDNNLSNADTAFSLGGAVNSWMYRVEVINSNRMLVLLYRTYRNTVRSCKFHESSHTLGQSNGGYGISFMPTASANLFEDNIVYNLGAAFIMDAQTSGNVFAYNYIVPPPMGQDNFYGQRGAFVIHAPYPHMNLFEGNIWTGVFNADFYHGSSGYNTVFRNKGALDTHPSASANWLISLFKKAHYYNFVGNILGSVGWEVTYEATGVSVDYSTSKIIYRLGHQDGSGYWQTSLTPLPYGPADTQVKATLLRHGNWDSVNNAVKWCTDPGEIGCQGGDGSHVLPNSLYLSSKPTWFGTVSWPPIGPDIPGYTNKIPAQLRYEGNYSYLSTQTCSELFGSCCSSNQICSTGSFTPSTDCSYCCVGGTCRTPTCGDGYCDPGETCPADNCCTGSVYNPSTQVCCSGTAYTGNCCSDSNCTSPLICNNYVCSAPIPICAGLVLLHHYDNNSAYGENSTHVYDFSGNGNNGSVQYNAFISTTGGKFFGASQFDGDGDYILVSNKPSLNFGSNVQFAISAWVKTNGTDTGQTLLSKRGSNGYLIWLNPGSRFFRIDEGPNNVDTSFTYPFDNNWHHIVAMRNLNYHSLWIDGVIRGTTADNTLADLTDPINLTIGNEQGWAPSAITGSIDELAIWNRSLSSQEIQSLYSSGQPISCGNCLHKSDINCSGCVENTELMSFISRWNINNQDVTIRELIVAIGLYKSGCA